MPNVDKHKPQPAPKPQHKRDPEAPKQHSNLPVPKEVLEGKPFIAPEKYWLEFIGEGRSGHTVIAAILDAHQHIRVSEELKIIHRWKQDPNTWTKEKIYTDLHSCGMGGERKNYRIRGASQLRFGDKLLVAGDKCGWSCIHAVRKGQAPATIYDEFSRFIERPVKIIHSVRDPFDNIASWYVSPKYQRIWQDDSTRAMKLIRRYRQFSATVQEVLEHLPDESVHTVYNEDLILSPEEELQKIFEFLEVYASRRQLFRYSRVIIKQPTNKSAQVKWMTNPEEEWEHEAMSRVVYLINRFPWLARYSLRGLNE